MLSHFEWDRLSLPLVVGFRNHFDQWHISRHMVAEAINMFILTLWPLMLQWSPWELGLGMRSLREHTWIFWPWNPDWPSRVTADQQTCEWKVSVVLSQKAWECLLHSTITVIAEKVRGWALLCYYNSSSRFHSLSLS